MLQRYAPKSSCKWIDIRTLRGSSISVDASIYLYQSLYSPYTSVYSNGVERVATYLTRHGINPIFIFDALDKNSNKQVETLKRSKKRLIQLDQIKQLESRLDRLDYLYNVLEISAHDPVSTTLLEFDLEKLKSVQKSWSTAKSLTCQHLNQDLHLISDIIELSSKEGSQNTHDILHNLIYTRNALNSKLSKSLQQSKRITVEMINDCKQMLDRMGISYKTALAGYEAEAVCAAMTTSGITAASLSEDMDTALFGDGLFLCKIFKSLDPNRPHDVMVIDVEAIRQEIGVSKREFLDICILMGTDFSGTLTSIGMVNAIKLVKNYGSIDVILETKKGLKIPENFNHILARQVFENVFECPKEWESLKPEKIKHEALTR